MLCFVHIHLNEFDSCYIFLNVCQDFKPLLRDEAMQFTRPKCDFHGDVAYGIACVHTVLQDTSSLKCHSIIMCCDDIMFSP